MLPRIVICSGGSLGVWALESIKPGDFLIGADKGASFLISNRLQPDVAIGDFDSVTEDELLAIRRQSGRIIECDPVDKDYTDTEMAFRLALDMRPKQIILLGALGSRFDHTLANVHLLSLAAEMQVQASIIDKQNKITLVAEQLKIQQEGFTAVSLLPLTTVVKGITLTGFQYPLKDAALRIGQSLGISNVLLETTGMIQVTEGQLLVIQSRD